MGRRTCEREKTASSCFYLLLLPEGPSEFADKTDDGRTYGHVGPQFQCCNRSVVDMKPAKYAKLYETEGYFLTGYNFHQLPKGSYLKCGWWLMDIWANGKKVADPIDLFDMQKGDFNQPAPFTFDATVGDDGELKIDFRLPKGYKGSGATVLFMNGNAVERK